MKKILLFHQGALGDLVTLFPVLIQLRSAYEVIDLICQSAIGRLACHLNLIDAAYPAESALFAPLFTGGPLHDRPDFFAAYHGVVLFSNSEILGRTVGRLTAGEVHRIAPRPPHDRRVHVTDYYVSELATRRVLPAEREYEEVSVHPKIISLQRNPDPDPQRVLLHPGSGSLLKNWPIAHFLALGERLKASGFQPELIIGPAEERLIPQGDKFRTSRQAAQLSFMDSLQSGSYGVHRPSDHVELAGLLKKVGGFIGNDSGVTHLAAFLGLATVAVFGPSDPIRWRPRGRAVAVVSTTETCSPCFEKAHRQCPGGPCLAAISPALVMGHFLRIRHQV